LSCTTPPFLECCAVAQLWKGAECHRCGVRNLRIKKAVSPVAQPSTSVVSQDCLSSVERCGSPGGGRSVISAGLWIALRICVAGRQSWVGVGYSTGGSGGGCRASLHGSTHSVRAWHDRDWSCGWCIASIRIPIVGSISLGCTSASQSERNEQRAVIVVKNLCCRSSVDHHVASAASYSEELETVSRAAVANPT
jgi:hypothetical protein